MEESKAKSLRQHGTLNRRPDRIRNALFAGRFFDPADMMQVKYEMLRAVQQDARSIADVTAEFGLSRPAFYRAKKNFEREGLAGLLPRKPGPKAPHKLSAEMLDFIGLQTTRDKRVRAQEVHERVRSEFGVQVHVRTVRRAMGREKKTGGRR